MTAFSRHPVAAGPFAIPTGLVMRPVIILAAGAALTLSACSESDPLSPENLAGTYPLAMVNGAEPGAYLPVGAVTCNAAFQVGSLEINRNGSFQLDVSYNYQCDPQGTNDGPGIISVAGNQSHVIGGVLYLQGCGPPTATTSCPAWSLDVRASPPNLTVQFLSEPALFWGDPVFTFGPRE